MMCRMFVLLYSLVIRVGMLVCGCNVIDFSVL